MVQLSKRTTWVHSGGGGAPPRSLKMVMVTIGAGLFFCCLFRMRALAAITSSSLLSTDRGGAAAEADAWPKSTYPLLLSPPPSQNGPHRDLLENLDGVFNEAACATWKHTGDQGPFKRFNCFLEWDEWMLVNAFINPGDVVMEFGARYGTTSCILSRAVGATGQVVSVDVDESVFGYLLLNRQNHGCHYHVVTGTVSTKPFYMYKHAGYALSVTDQPGNNKAAIPHISVPQVEAHIGAKINVALIDCEGCIQSVEDNGMFDSDSGVDVILMEEDGPPELANYTYWHDRLTSHHGYSCVWFIKDSSFALKHSAWVHERVKDTRDYPSSCEEYVASKGFRTTMEGKLKPQIVCEKCPE